MSFFAVEALAQFPITWTAQFQHTSSFGYSNEGRRVAEDASGNIFILSDVTSNIDPNGVLGTINYHYVNLTKYSSTGSILAKTNVEIKDHVTVGFNNYSAFGLEVDASGMVYIGFAMWNNTANFDVVLAKYNNALNAVPLWINNYSTPGSDLGVDMKVSPSGTLYAVIKSTNITTAYTLIKGNAAGTAPTTVYTFTANSTVINSLAIDGFSRAYVAGYLTQSFSKNVYVAEINTSNNTLVWGTTYSGKGVIGDDVANKITIGVDGKIYTVGSTFISGAQGTQTLVLRNTQGNPHFDFVKTLKGGGLINASGVQISATESGWLYIGAITTTQATVFRIPSNGVFTVPTYVTYNPTPTASFTAVTGVTLSALKVSSVKNIYITGSVSVTSASGPYTCSYFNKASVVFGNALNKSGGMPIDGSYSHNYEGVDISLDYGKADVYWLRNYWDASHNTEKVELIDLNVPSPLRETNSELNTVATISLYPNPAKNEVMVQSDDIINAVEIMDLTGNRVLFMEIKSEQALLDISTLSNGIYLCRIQTEQGSTIKRLAVN